MKKDSLNAGLDKPAIWASYVDWSYIHQMGEIYMPAEEEIQSVISKILQTRDVDQLKTLRKALADAVGKMAVATEPLNAVLIKGMSQKLQSLVEAQEKN